MQEPASILEQYWGYDSFRPMQEDIIRSVLQGRDTLAVLPTGGGKSICFQVPAMANEGICIVVSPLIALMKDQVEGLKRRGIPALLIHSGMKKPDVMQTLKNATHSYFKFLYVSPERLETSLFLEYLPAFHVNLIAVDEAHCISQWGYDFRPSYLRIAALRKELPGVPVLALTASATPEVQKDICEKLHFAGEVIFRQSFERPNLSYSAFPVEARLSRLVDIVSTVQGSAIVYCRSRRRTTEIASLLQLHGITADNYHAGLSPEERNSRQQDWISNKIRVMACTNAFGMGIDKPDVRLVVHADLPDCLENYYQEAGRAGRDREKSYAVLLYGQKDLEDLAQEHHIRYPSTDRIRAVYQALVNFLQVPAYSGEYKSFSFHFDEFTRNFHLRNQEALYALKALEQDGWIYFNEKNFTPSTVVFTTSKDQLYQFQSGHPEYEMLLTTMLRTYEGIFDFPAFISEMLLAKLLRVHEDEIKKQLKAVHSFGLISYSPQNDDPQIVFTRQRVPAAEFSFREGPYNKRKEAFIRRAQTMISYATTSECRSRFSARYFGDETAKDCGVCDNCLARRSNEVSAEEFEKISGLIRHHLSEKQLTIMQLMDQLRSVRKEKTWTVLNFLQSEKKVFVDDRGMLHLKS